MNVLGLNQIQGMFVWVHDSSAALVKDGKLIASAEEERFNRLRHYKGYPYKAVDYCLAEGRLEKKDIDVIAIGYDPNEWMRHFPWNFHWKQLGQHLINNGVFMYSNAYFKKEFPNARIEYIPHHLAHAASAYRCSGFDEANILTLDGSGETETFAFFTGRAGKIQRVWDIKCHRVPWRSNKESSIGFMYTAVTRLLKLGDYAEGKTMGLASYGKPRFDLSKIFNIRSHKEYVIDRAMLSTTFGHLKREERDEPITQDQKDLAASLQHALEEAIANLAREAYQHSGIRNFCLAGGVALNCNTNSRIAESDFCDNLFVQPAASDGGVSIGAALEAAARSGEKAHETMETAYWGPGYTDAEIEHVLKDAKVKYEKRPDLEEATAELLAEGKIVGWFQGRLEIGPRALGNRSILADPTVPGMNDRVNTVKHREKWRPFAPVVLEEEGRTYFEKYRTSPFMLLTFMVRPEYREKLPAITHVDGSSRIQTVNRKQNERIYKVLEAFKKKKGVAVLMNTSFNDKDEPIVCSPKDALKCFYGTSLDALVMGSFLVRKQ